MLIAGMVKTSLVDYPGLVSCALFSPGCNYDCFYCHNRALLGQPQALIPLEQILDFLKKRAGRLDGVVFSGGEPTRQQGLREVMAKVRELGYQVKLDTNGSFPRQVEALLRAKLCDYVAVDYKAPSARYGEICGPAGNPRQVLATIELLLRGSTPFEVRTTVIPQLQRADLRQMARELPRLPRYVLNRYRRPEAFKPADKRKVAATPYTQAELDGLAAELRQLQPNIRSGAG